MEAAWSTRTGAPRWVPATIAISAALTALAIVAIDRPVARAVAGYEPLGVWTAGIELLEWAVLLPVWRFALPVALVAGMLATVAVPRWRRLAPGWMFVAAVHLVSRLTTNWIKDATGRLRPGGWLEAGGGDMFFEGGHSFPSGHVALFASVALPVIVLWPRARVPMIAITAFAALARIGASAHFVSDTIGAVTLVALWMWLAGALARPRRASP